MKNSTQWQWTAAPELMPAAFASLDKVFALRGEVITRDRLSELLKVTIADETFYLKRYSQAAKGLRRYFGKPRIQREWENLLWFAKKGIPTAEVVACGMETKLGLFQRGAMITREIPDAMDLATLARTMDPRLQDRAWVAQISAQAAQMLWQMHRHGFIHNDYKWRNLLVDSSNKLYIIDSPMGCYWPHPLFRYRMIKEIAMLDRVAKYRLRATQRLNFFLIYRGHQRLEADDKKILRQLLGRKERRPSSFAILAAYFLLIQAYDG